MATTRTSKAPAAPKPAAIAKPAAAAAPKEPKESKADAGIEVEFLRPARHAGKSYAVGDRVTVDEIRARRWVEGSLARAVSGRLGRLNAPKAVAEPDTDEDEDENPDDESDEGEDAAAESDADEDAGDDAESAETGEESAEE